MARRERKACLSYCRLSCYLSFHMSRLKKSLLLSFFFFVCLFVFLRRGEGEGRLKDDKKRIIMRSFSRPKWMTIKSSQPHKHYKSNKKSQKKFPSSRIRTSDLRISINVSTVLRSTNWAIEGTFDSHEPSATSETMQWGNTTLLPMIDVNSFTSSKVIS